MKKVTIDLYSFDELSIEGKKKAVFEHGAFLKSFDEPTNRAYVIESIRANDYLFFGNGTLAHCTTYVGGHAKAGTTEFHLHGQTFDITN